MKKIPHSIKTAVCHVSTFINRKDIFQVLFGVYRKIDPVYRHSFWIIFGVLCFAFSFHTIQFMWGNHDWSHLDSKHMWLEHAWEGRYLVPAIKMVLADGVYLPLVHDFIIFITLALNAVLLCKYWHLKKKVTYFVICGLVLTVQPFTLCMMYFVNMTPEVFIGVTCVLAALILSEHTALTEEPLIKKICYSLIAIVLVNFSLATYPVLLTTIAVLFVGRLLVKSFDWDGSGHQLKSYLITFSISAVNIILGVALYKLILTFVLPVRSYYNTDTLPLGQVPKRLGALFRQCLHQLYEYNFPFITQWVLWVFLGFSIVLTLYICFTGNFRQKIVRFSLLFGSLFATQVAMIVAKSHVVACRVDLFGLVFFEVLVMAVALTHLRKLCNISMLAGVCVIFSSVLHDLDCLRVWKLGFDSEKMLWNRVLARLEVQKDFDPAKKYDVVQIGDPISMRPRYYTGGKTSISHLLYYSYDPGFSVFSALRFYYPTRFRNKGFSSTYARKLVSQHRGYEALLKRLYQAGILQKAGVWPKPNGLIVWKDIILFVTSSKELNNVKKRLARELGKK